MAKTTEQTEAETVIAMAERIKELKAALEGMCHQFAGWRNGGCSTDGLSATEEAFGVLGWDDPHIVKGMQCAEPECDRQVTCGFNTTEGYRRTCGPHSRCKSF